jgi:acyl-CoA thioester hydrolase
MRTCGGINSRPVEPAYDRGLFSWNLRVYFEDTDAGGIVYYANFLKFFERCRTEWLRALGVEQVQLAQQTQRQFVVAQLAVDYVRPARLDDLLTITAQVGELARSYLVFEQRALRGSDELARARVKVACVDTGRLAPARLPAQLISAVAAARPASGPLKSENNER